MSQRPILLVDPDRDFHALLTRELGPYGFQIVQDVSADALAQVAKLGVVAVIISVDEPDKKGYATFNKAKKGVAAGVPVVLVTSSVPGDAFAAHRKLKVHADEYLDKRELSTAELIGKLDNLIGLGDLAADGELAIPVEVDEVPLDDDVLVDEVDSAALDLGDAEDFHEGGHTQHTADAFDDLIDAETDAAFAMLTDAMPLEVAQQALGRAPAAAPEPALEAEVEPIPEPVMDAPMAPAEPPPLLLAADDAVEGFESVSASISLTDLEPLSVSDAAIALPVEELRPPPPPPEEPRPRTRPTSPPPRGRGTMPPPPPGADRGGGFALEPAPVVVAPAPAPAPAPPVVAPEPIAVAPEPIAVAPEPAPVAPAPAPVVAPEPMSAIETLLAMPAPAPAPEPSRRRSGSTTAPAPEPDGPVDLGLDELAARADAEQSGVHDRKSLQKLHALERDNQRLRAELDKARAEPAPVKPVSREREFLNLRETLSSKDKELLGLRDELSHKERELLEAREKTRQLQHAKSAVESKNVELEARLLGDNERAETAEQAAMEARSRITALETRLARTSADAETARAARPRPRSRSSRPATPPRWPSSIASTPRPASEPAPRPSRRSPRPAPRASAPSRRPAPRPSRPRSRSPPPPPPSRPRPPPPPSTRSPPRAARPPRPARPRCWPCSPSWPRSTPA